MRAVWYSNVPWAPTGYGTQSAQVLRRMKADGHEMGVLSNYGHQIGVWDWEGIPVYPQGVINYSLDVIDHQARVHLENGPGWVFTLYDVWVLPPTTWQDQRVVSWTPVDHYPPPPGVAAWAQKHKTIAMSRFGQDALRDVGVESVYIPHGIERVYSPAPSDIRNRMRVPDDAFLVAINAANIGNVPARKAWDQNMLAMAAFAKDHPDVYLYVHSDLTRPGGVPIARMAKFWGFPMEDRFIVCDQDMYRWGAIGNDEMARIYTASDVLLGVSMGEGFGLAVPEAMACGTPAIVSSFSAQPEIVGDTGWLVSGQLTYDYGQPDAALLTPFIESIRDALEQAYEERGTDKAKARSEAAIAKVRADYDADTVYDTMWRPLIRELEDDLKPIVKRQGKSKAAQRRNRKLQAVK